MLLKQLRPPPGAGDDAFRRLMLKQRISSASAQNDRFFSPFLNSAFIIAWVEAVALCVTHAEGYPRVMIGM